MVMGKRVLQVVTRLNVGGPTKYLAWLSSGLEERGWTVLLACGLTEGHEIDMSNYVAKYGITINYFDSITASIDIRKDARAILDIYKLLCVYQPSIAHSHTSKAGVICRLAVMLYNMRHLKKIKTVHTFHGHILRGYFSPAKQYFFQLLERFLAKYATNAIVTISSQQQIEIRDDLKIGKNKQHYKINLGIDASFSDELDRYSLRKKLGIPADSKVFGIVGRITEIKNHQLFIDAAHDFFKSYPCSNVYFLVIGSGEKSYVDKIKSYASDIPQIIFAGNQSDPRQFYGSLDYLVLTSKNEGTPVAILESFACEVPVISTGVGGVIDLIGNNERGLIVEANSKALSKSFELFLKTNHEKTKKMAKEFIALNYSLDSSERQIEALYSDLIEE